MYFSQMSKNKTYELSVLYQICSKPVVNILEIEDPFNQ